MSPAARSFSADRLSVKFYLSIELKRRNSKKEREGTDGWREGKGGTAHGWTDEETEGGCKGRTDRRTDRVTER